MMSKFRIIAVDSYASVFLIFKDFSYASNGID